MIDFVLNHVPVWVWVAIVVAGLLATVPFWKPLWDLLPNSAKALIIGVGAVILAFLAGKRSGSKGEIARQKAASAKAVQNRNEVDNEVAKKTDAAVDRDLSKWMRHD